MGTNYRNTHEIKIDSYYLNVDGYNIIYYLLYIIYYNQYFRMNGIIEAYLCKKNTI